MSEFSTHLTPNRMAVPWLQLSAVLPPITVLTRLTLVLTSNRALVVAVRRRLHPYWPCAPAFRVRILYLSRPSMGTIVMTLARCWPGGNNGTLRQLPAIPVWDGHFGASHHRNNVLNNMEVQSNIPMSCFGVVTIASMSGTGLHCLHWKLVKDISTFRLCVVDFVFNASMASPEPSDRAFLKWSVQRVA